MIEFGKDPVSLADFTWELDVALKSFNSDYEAKRQKDIAMQAPLVHALPKGSFHEWLRSKDKLGGQHKVPRLSNDRKILDELHEIVRNS
jgi:hypothetical protein